MGIYPLAGWIRRYFAAATCIVEEVGYRISSHLSGECTAAYMAVGHFVKLRKKYGKTGTIDKKRIRLEVPNLAAWSIACPNSIAPPLLNESRKFTLPLQPPFGKDLTLPLIALAPKMGWSMSTALKRKKMFHATERLWQLSSAWVTNIQIQTSP